MQIRNAAYGRQLDLLDCRTAMLGLDLYAIESDNTFQELETSLFQLQLSRSLRGGPEA